MSEKRSHFSARRRISFRAKLADSSAVGMIPAVETSSTMVSFYFIIDMFLVSMYFWRCYTGPSVAYGGRGRKHMPTTT